MARMASLSEVEEEDEDADLRFRPAAVVAVAVGREQHVSMNLEEVRRVVEEAKWISCFSGCDDALHTFHASIFPLPFFHYPLSLYRPSGYRLASSWSHVLNLSFREIRLKELSKAH